MPPIVAQLEVESSGAKNRPWGLSAALSWSLTMSACDHARLHAHAAALRVDVQDAVHVARHVHDQPAGERLSVRARAAAARSELEPVEARVVEQARDAHQILGSPREGDSLRCDLVDGV